MQRPALLPATLLLGLIALLFTPTSTVAQADATSEGLTVHGDWVIEVYDADGTLADRREFSNDMTSDGEEVLAWSLTQQGSFSLQAIELTGCREVSGSASAEPCFLDVSTNQDGLDSGEASGYPSDVVLSGSITAELPSLGTSDVTAVNTVAAYCDPNANPCEVAVGPSGVGSPSDGSIVRFTEATLGSPVEIADGQLVEVTVTISFSN